MDKVQDVDDTARSSITIIKWVDAFKPVVNDRHFYKRISIIDVRIIDEFLKMIHPSNDRIMILWWGVYNLIRPGITKHRTREFPEPCFVTFDDSLNLKNMIAGDQMM